MTEPTEKRGRGNPNFKRGQKPPYARKAQQTDTTAMSEEKDQHGAPDAAQSRNTPPPAPQATDLPLDIFDDTLPDEQLPLDGEVESKDYATIKEPGAANATGAAPGAIPGVPGSGAASTEGPVPGQPARTPEEIQTAAEQLVKMMLKGYEKLHGLGRWYGKVDQSELQSLHMKGKIDMAHELPVGKNTITVGDFFKDFNTGIDETIVVTDEFKEAITPPLVRICIKRGWSLGDEMFVGMLVAEDLATKVSMLVGLKKSANMVLEACMALQKANNPTADPKAEEAKKETPEGGVEDVTFTMTDATDTWREQPEG